MNVINISLLLIRDCKCKVHIRLKLGAKQTYHNLVTSVCASRGGVVKAQCLPFLYLPEHHSHTAKLAQLLHLHNNLVSVYNCILSLRYSSAHVTFLYTYSKMSCFIFVHILCGEMFSQFSPSQLLYWNFYIWTGMIQLPNCWKCGTGSNASPKLLYPGEEVWGETPVISQSW